MRRQITTWLLALTPLVGMGCALFPPSPPRHLPPAWEVHRIRERALDESSGLVASRKHEGVFWTHNDSDDSPRIFAINARGELIGEFPVEGVAEQIDWEDIAADDAGNLYLGDFGNNCNERIDLRVYRVPEPDPFTASSARVDRILPFRYADQRGFPEWGHRNFDAEALFWMDGALYILTKHRSDTATKLYELPVTGGGEERSLEPIARFELGGTRHRFFGIVTGADLRRDGRMLAVLSYRAIHLFERTPDGEAPFRPVRRIALDVRATGLAESIAWVGDSLLFGNEQGYLYPIPDPLAPGLDRYPPSEIPAPDAARVNGKSRHRRQIAASGISSQGAFAR